MPRRCSSRDHEDHPVGVPWAPFFFFALSFVSSEAFSLSYVRVGRTLVRVSSPGCINAFAREINIIVVSVRCSIPLRKQNKRVAQPLAAVARFRVLLMMVDTVSFMRYIVIGSVMVSDIPREREKRREREGGREGGGERLPYATETKRANTAAVH